MEYLKNRATFQDRFRMTKVHLDDFVSPGRRRYGVWVAPEIDMTDYDEYAVASGDLMRPDLIAFRFYKDVALWWVVCLVNGIRNPFEELEVGLVLKIPKMSAIVDAFSGVTRE